MSETVSIQQRIQQLRRLSAEMPDILYKAQANAARAAVNAAIAATPPKEGTGRGPYTGTNTVTGELKQHWATDSIIEPTGGGLSGGTQYTSFLNNNVQYASYVNDGHRMDRHFVPGLYVNPESGLLEYDFSAKVGLVVGTKTKYVKGEFMVDKAKEAYQKSLRKSLDKEIRRRTR